MNKQNISKYLLDKADFQKSKKPIGSGTFGEVFVFTKNGTGEQLIGKKLKFESKEYFIGFLREIHILTIDFPTILHIKGWNALGNHPMLFTEFKERGNLKDFIEITSKNKKLFMTPTQKQKVLFGISKGMEVLHFNDVIYRDLKPDNILLDINMYPTLSDFNISKFHSSAQRTQSIIAGTKDYYAPELKKNNYHYTNKVDVYSFGCIMYELIVYNIHKERKPDFVKKVKSDATLNSEKYKNFQKLILKCLQRDPQKRPTFEEISLFIKENYLPEVLEFDFDAYSNYLINFKSTEKVIKLSKEDEIDSGINLYRIACDAEKNNEVFKSANLFNLSFRLGHADSENKYYESLRLLGKYYEGQNKISYAIKCYKEILEKYTDKDVIQSLIGLYKNRNEPDEVKWCQEMLDKISKKKESSSENENSSDISDDIDGSDFSSEFSSQQQEEEEEDKKSYSDDLFQTDHQIKSSSKEEQVMSDKSNSEKIIQVLEKPIDIQQSMNASQPRKNAFTNFHDIIKYKFLNSPVNVIAAVVHFEEKSKKEKPMDQFYKLRIIDEDSNQITATIYSKQILELFQKEICISNQKRSLPIAFCQVQFRAYKGIISMIGKDNSQAFKLSSKSSNYQFMIKKYCEFIMNANNGIFYKNVFPIAQVTDINKDIFQANKEQVLIVPAKIESIEYSMIKYIHLNRNIIEDFDLKYNVIINDNNMLQIVDNNKNDELMMPQLFLKVKLVNPENQHEFIWASVSRPEIVDCILNFANIKININEELQQSKSIDNFKESIRSLIRKYENIQFEIIKKMLIRIYAKDNSGKKVACVEKIYDDQSYEIEYDSECKERNEILLGTISDDIYYYNENKMKELADEGKSVKNILSYASYLKCVNNDISNSIKYYEKAAMLFNASPEAYFEYGKMLLEIYNDENGLHYIEKASNSCYEMARLYLNSLKNKNISSKKVSPRFL